MKKTLAALAAAALASLGALSVAPTTSAAGGQDEPAVPHEIQVADSYIVDGGTAKMKSIEDGALPMYYRIDGGELRDDGTGIIHVSLRGAKAEPIDVTYWEMDKYGGYMNFMFHGDPYHGQLLLWIFEDTFEGEFTNLNGDEIDFEPIALLPAE